MAADFLYGGFMDTYLTVAGVSEFELVEKHSRFIATLKNTATDEEAVNFINEMRSKYSDAKHNCYAYSAENGKYRRFSDDGEPHGTAGKPILDVIDGSGITDCTIVVTRYFGGILLGTGGLVRAYSAAAKGATEAAEKVMMTPCTVYSSRCGYAERERLLKIIADFGGTVEKIDYSSELDVTYFLKDGVCADYENKLTDTFSARIKAQKLGNRILPVKL